MIKKNTIRLAILAVLLAGTFMVLHSKAPVAKADSCKESLDGCCKKEEKNSGGMIWENISHQFFSSM